MRSIHDICKLRGLQLYEFRINQEEFNAITQLLKQRIHASHNNILGDISFCALFVLYAAEWWKRYFDGSRWRWEPIIDSIDGKPEQWKRIRSECVRKGLKHWHIPMLDCGGLRYLGAIAVQGGLPIRLLQDARGDIGALLNRVLVLADNSNASDSQIRQWVESKKNSLPNSYRHESIYYLLAQVILTTLKLKNEAKLKASDDAIAVLNKRIPKWKARFPVDLDDQAADGLLNQLVMDAASIQRSRTIRLFSVVRTLQAPQQDETDWRSYSDVNCDEVLTCDMLQRFFDCKKLTSNELQLCYSFDHVNKHTVNLYKCIGSEKYRIDKSSFWHAEESAAYAEHRLTLRNSKGGEWHAIASAGEALDATLPWLFTPSGSNNWQFKRQGGGKFAASSILLAIPKSWSCYLEKYGQWQNRALFKITTDTTIIDPEEQRFRIRPCSADEEDVQYMWQGERIWEGIQLPNLAFKNTPSLYKKENNDACSSAVPSASIMWRCCGEKEWQYHFADLLGPVEARYPCQGELKLRARMLLLPKDATVKLQSGQDGTQGTLCFENWGIHSAHLLSADLSASSEKKGDSIFLHIQCSQGKNPPEIVNIELHWRHTLTTAKVSYPFPTTGMRLFDGQGRDVTKERTSLSAYDLIGYRLWAFGSSRPVLKLDKIYRLEAVNERIEIRLIDYAIEIQQMLSDCKSSDDHINMALELPNQQFRLQFFRYAGTLEADIGSHRVILDATLRREYTTEELAAIPVYALRLDDPGEEPEKLNIAYSEHVSFGGWEFNFSCHAEAPWLIYTLSDSPVHLRALLWPCEYDEGDGSLLAKAIRTADPSQRKRKLIEALEEMAKDYTHPEWLMVEQLAKELGHLPLATLDLWQQFIHVPNAMTALIFRISSLPEGFVERFTIERPFVWETIPALVWLDATRCLKQQCKQYFATTSEQMFFITLKDSIEKIQRITLAFNYMLDWVEGICKKKQFTTTPAMDVHFRNQLFESNDAFIHEIRRNHANEQWPEDFNGVVFKNMEDEMKVFLYSVKIKYRSSIVNLPIMLAYWAATNSLPENFLSKENILAIRKHQRFDPVWFTEAFDITIARCLTLEILKMEDL